MKSLAPSSQLKSVGNDRLLLFYFQYVKGNPDNVLVKLASADNSFFHEIRELV